MKILKQTIYIAVSDEDFNKYGIDCLDAALEDEPDLNNTFEVMYGPIQVTEAAFPDPIVENTEESGEQQDLWETYARGYMRGMFGDLITDLGRRIL